MRTEEPVSSLVLVLVPHALGERVAERLRRAWADTDADVLVLVERRAQERRAPAERRVRRVPVATDRRATTHPDGRRAGERRGAQAPVALTLKLPLRSRMHGRRIAAVTYTPLAPALADERAVARALVGVQRGDGAQMRIVFERWYARVHGYASVVLEDSRGAQALAQETFLRALAEAPRYDFAGERFAVRLLTWLHELAGDRLDDGGLHEDGRSGTVAAERIGWVSDSDLLVLLRTLPPLHRRLLVLRHIVGLDGDEAARLLGVDAPTAGHTLSEGMATLAGRVHDLGSAAAWDGTRVSMAWLRLISPVLRTRGRPLAPSSY
jgi:DNA-directed RNA polymerase specialized sigma24 family protein